MTNHFGTAIVDPMPLTELYVLADKYDIEKPKNDIIICFFEANGYFPRSMPMSEEVSYFYYSSPAKSPFRRLLVDWHIWHSLDEFFVEEGSAAFVLAAPDFAVDLATALAKRWKNPTAKNPFQGSPSAYYARPRKIEEVNTQKSEDLLWVEISIQESKLEARTSWLQKQRC